MKRLILSLACLAALFRAGATFAEPQLDHPLPGGYLDIDYFAGSGAQTAFFITDFGGNGGDVHGFGFRWDGAQTADNALLEIDAAGALDLTTINFGSPPQPNFFIDRLTYLPDSDQPVFNVDGRFWHYWLGTYAVGSPAGDVMWQEANVGISGRDFVTGDIIHTLADGGFYGFYASAGAVPPRLPIAVPEPAAFSLATFGVAMLLARLRRRASR